MISNRWPWSVALCLLALVVALAACSAPLDEAGARKAATDYYMALDHEGDNAPVDVVITDIKRGASGGNPGWEVAINGRIVLPGLPEGYLSAMILFVDGSSGAVTVIAQGWGRGFLGQSRCLRWAV